MSHSIVVTRTTTTTTGNTSGFIVNSGYLKTTPGLLKLAQLVRARPHRVMTKFWFFFSFAFVSDSQCNLRGYHCMEFQTLQSRLLKWKSRTFLPAHDDDIFDRDLLSPSVLSCLLEYGRNYLENNLRIDLPCPCFPPHPHCVHHFARGGFQQSLQ